MLSFSDLRDKGDARPEITAETAPETVTAADTDDQAAGGTCHAD